MNCSMPGFPVRHQLPELAQTHVHRVSDTIQPSHPLSSPSPPTFNLSQHQGLFQWVSSLHQVAKVLEFQLQHQSFQWSTACPLHWKAVLTAGPPGKSQGVVLRLQACGHLWQWPQESNIPSRPISSLALFCPLTPHSLISWGRGFINGSPTHSASATGNLI